MREAELGTIDANLERLVADRDRLLDAIAHQLGAVMLPTLKGPKPGQEVDAGMRRLTIMAGAMATHLRGEKAVLDALRGSYAADGEAWEPVEWVSRFRSPLGALGGPEGPEILYHVTADAPIKLARAVAVLTIWLGTLNDGAGIVIDIEHGTSGSRLRVQNIPDAPRQIPTAVQAAAAHSGCGPFGWTQEGCLATSA
jgi:hypothetical protein